MWNLGKVSGNSFHLFRSHWATASFRYMARVAKVSAVSPPDRLDAYRAPKVMPKAMYARTSANRLLLTRHL